MESFDAYVGGGDELQGDPSRPFDSDGYVGFDPRLPSQRFESFHMPDDEEPKDLDDDYQGSNGFDHDLPPPYENAFDDDLAGGQSPALSSSFGQSFEPSPQPDFAPPHEFSPSIDSNGKGFSHGEADGLYDFAGSGPLNGAVLPPPEEMQAEEGFLLREWKRQNAILLEEKARKERENLLRIIDAADSFKAEFYEKRRFNCESSKINNREKEKVFLESHEKFHATADKHYWKAVAELIPHELPSMEVKSRGKKDKDKKPSVINHGPKPGKATDLTRMRHVLLKLKHNPPAHMKAPPAPPVAAPAAEASDATSPEAPLQKQGSIQTVAGA